MHLYDVMLLACGADNDLLEDVLETIMFVEGDDNNDQTVSIPDQGGEQRLERGA